MTHPLRRPFLVSAFLAIVSAPVAADNLNMTIKGGDQEKVPLETLAPTPDVPKADSLSFSLDGGKSAMEGELIPISLGEAALMTDATHLPAAGLSLIPSAPFILHQLPTKLELDRSRTRREKAAGASTMAWTFTVKDDVGNELYVSSGTGMPPNPLTWDGMSDGQFALQPDRVYNSFVVVESSPNVTTFPGVGVRYLAFLHRVSSDTVITFGDRIYVPERSQFSGEGLFYLEDVARRISSLPPSDEPVSPWKVTIKEPEETLETLGPARLRAWKTQLEKMLDAALPDDRFALARADGDKSTVDILLRHAPLPTTDGALRGEARTSGPQMEPMSSLVRVRDTKEALIVELRHDRLFQPGSAYLRDEALPYLLQAMAQVRAAANPPQDLSEINAKEHEDGRKKADKPAPPRKILIRSFTEKTRDKRRDELEDDPRLAAARSKVLLMLFAKEGLMPTGDPHQTAAH